MVNFDFWSTLYFEDESNIDKSNKKRASYINDLALKYGKILTEEAILEAIKFEQRAFYEVWLNEHKTILPETRLKMCLNRLTLNISDEDFKTLSEQVENIFFDYPPLITVNVKKVLEYLTNNGITLGIISDTGYTKGVLLKKLMEKEGILKYFNIFSFSDETGVAKPQPKAFEAIFDNVNISPQDSLHIGDVEKTDIKGACNFGMYACLYTGVRNELILNNFNTASHFQIADWLELLERIEV
jgi:putative hydrolase of the HAD superfamily